MEANYCFAVVDIRVVPFTAITLQSNSVAFMYACSDEDCVNFSIVNFDTESANFFAFFKLDTLVVSNFGPTDHGKLFASLSFVIFHHNLQR